MMQDIALEGGKAIAGQAARGHAFTSFSFAGAIITFFADWSQTITTLAVVCSAIIGGWYYYRTIKLKERELDLSQNAIRVQRALEATRTAPEQERQILEKYLGKC